jgi:hypothetical protein
VPRGGIEPRIEETQGVVAEDVRFRFVIDNSTLPQAAASPWNRKAIKVLIDP